MGDSTINCIAVATLLLTAIFDLGFVTFDTAAANSIIVCGNVTHDANEMLCCDGVTHQKHSAVLACCGSGVYDSTAD